jgi:hypothetical protein
VALLGITIFLFVQPTLDINLKINFTVGVLRILGLQKKLYSEWHNEGSTILVTHHWKLLSCFLDQGLA